MSEVKYTHDDWRQFKKELGLDNKQLAKIVGQKVDSVRSTTAPGKGELPTWARAMLYVYHRTKVDREAILNALGSE